jgi:hypothetical protein
MATQRDSGLWMGLAWLGLTGLREARRDHIRQLSVFVNEALDALPAANVFYVSNTLA